jgi:hypothetical protein
MCVWGGGGARLARECVCLKGLGELRNEDSSLITQAKSQCKIN